MWVWRRMESAVSGNDGTGIVVDEGAESNQIGGATAAERNIISANGGNGIGVWVNVKDNIIIGNFICADASGTVARELLPGHRIRCCGSE